MSELQQKLARRRSLNGEEESNTALSSNIKPSETIKYIVKDNTNKRESELEKKLAQQRLKIEPYTVSESELQG